MSRSTLARRIFSILLALGLPLLALGVKIAFDRYIGHAVPFLLFFGTVIAVAWHCGRNYGGLAAVWAGFLATAAFVPSSGLDLPRLVQMVVFAAEGAFISVLTARCRQALDNQAARVQRQTALAQIAGLALRHGSDLTGIYAQSSQICTDTLGLSRVVVWQSGNNLFSSGDEDENFFRSVLQAQQPVVLPGFTATSPTLPEKWRQGARAALAVPIGDREMPFGVLLALDDEPNVWVGEEAEFLTAVAGVLAFAAHRSQVEELRRNDEARYRAFVEQSSEAIWCCEFTPPLDLARGEDQLIEDAYAYGKLTECNDAFARMYGFTSATELLGASLSDLLVREEPRNVEYLRAFFRSGYRLTDAHSVEVDRQGRRVEFSNNLLGILDDEVLLRVWGTQRDISAEQEATARLRASEARFRSLADAAPVAIAITRDGILLYVNQAAITLLGCETEWEMIGHPVNEFVAPPDREIMQQRIERRAEGFEGPLVYEATSLRRDGTTRPFRIEVSPLDLPDGPATLAFAFDLTQEKAAEVQRQLLLDTERRSAHRAIRLQQITASLAATEKLTSDEVVRLIITQGAEALGASSGALCEKVEDATGSYMTIVASVGYSEAILDRYGRMPMDPTLPVVQAYLENKPFWTETREETIQAHPIFSESVQRTGSQALCALPLEVEGRVLGVLSLSFGTPQVFDEETRAFMLTLAGQCAQALDRVRLFNEVALASRMQQESLALLNTLLASAPVGIAFYDLNCRHVLVNEALSKIDGIPVEEHWGKTPTEIVPQGAGKVEGIITRVIREGQPVSDLEYTGPIHRGSSEIYHLLISFYPVHVEGGEISGVGSMILDVTERTRDERDRLHLMGELEIERARFEAILQQMPSAVLIAEAPSGRLILANPQAEVVLKRPYVALNSIEEYGLFQGYHPDGSEIRPNEWPLARAIEAGQTISGEQIVIGRGDGSMGIVRMNAAPIRDRDGLVTAGIAIFDDVTRSARAENAQRFLAEAGSALLSTLDETEVYEKLTKLCVPRIADWCLVVVPGSDGDTAQVTVLQADPQKSAAAQNYKERLSRSNQLPWDKAHGSKKSLLISDEEIETTLGLGGSGEYTRLMQEIGAHSIIVAPLGARGRTLGVMIWITAESERSYDDSDRELADELARRAGLTADSARLYKEAQIARDAAQNANRAKDEFLAVVSHELRTPLTPIMGWLELLRSPSLDDAMRNQAYNVIERNARAQGQLVNDILDVSRITTGKLRMEMKPASLAPLVRLAVEALRTNADSKEITLELAIEDIGEANLDVNRIQQVVWNLMQNAIKFTPEGGRIRVGLEREGEMARISVSDTGSGIDPEFLPFVFDRFRQADSSSTRRAGGLGLGLAIVEHIVEGHGGHATAWSEGEGQGARFTIELPLLPIPALATTVSPDVPLREVGVLDGLSIVVTDDEPDTRDMMQVLLQSHGATVKTASSAQKTLNLLQDFTPDLLISDIGMPVVDGYELRQELTQRGFDKPSIALTAYTAPRDEQRAIEAGFSAHLGKPVDADSLLKLITKLAKGESPGH
jgi:PAS domain S-box-containing protein